MKVLLILLAYSFSFVAFGQNSGSFSVLTYNVAGLPQGLSSSNPRNNMPLISPLLNEFDMVLVQEDFHFHQQLVSEARFPFQSKFAPRGFFRMGDGLNRFSVFPFSPLYRKKWAKCYGVFSASNDCLTPKGFTYASHQLAPGILVDVYNIHMDAGGSVKDLNAKTIDMQQLADQILKYSKDRAVILAGDFNLNKRRPADKVILDAFEFKTKMINVCEQVDCPDERIDRIYLRGNNKIELNAVDYQNLKDEFVNQYGEDLSDHEPIMARIEWIKL